MSTAAPRVTVFIPVYNRERYLVETLDSVLAQSFTDFEVVLVDDGSVDRSIEIIEAYQDPRIRLFRNEKNLGIPRTRNRGLEEARGEFIALLDSDDIMLPKRLQTQLDYFDAHAECVGLGSWSQYINAEGKVIKRLCTRPLSNQKIKASLLFHCAIHNRTFMARASVLKELGYNNDFTRCQDYELLMRLADFGELHNLPKRLVLGRKHDDQITFNTSTVGDQKKCLIAADALLKLGVKFTAEDLQRHIKIARPKALAETDPDFFLWAADWLQMLLQANRDKRVYNQIALAQVVFKMWLRIAIKGWGITGLTKTYLFKQRLNACALAYLLPPYG